MTARSVLDGRPVEYVGWVYSDDKTLVSENQGNDLEVEKELDI